MFLADLSTWSSLGLSTLALSAPLVLAAVAGLISERSGVMNIALEGKMLTAALLTALIAARFENAWLGILAGLGAACLLSLLHALLTQAYRLDHIVSGMAINVIAFGGTAFLDKRFTDFTRTSEIPQAPLSFFFACAILVPLLASLYLAKTRGGLRLLAIGNDPDKARQMGVEAVPIRYRALLMTGVLCGLAGALIVSDAGRFTDNMTAGKGFIALAAVILGGWRPLPSAFACLIFGFLSALQLQLQGTQLMGAQLPSQFWSSLPYLMTLVVLAGVLGKSRTPAGLGKP